MNSELWFSVFLSVFRSFFSSSLRFNCKFPSNNRRSVQSHSHCQEIYAFFPGVWAWLDRWEASMYEASKWLRELASALVVQWTGRIPTQKWRSATHSHTAHCCVSLSSTNIHQITSQEIGTTKTIKVIQGSAVVVITDYNILISCVSLSCRSRDPIPRDQLSLPWFLFSFSFLFTYSLSLAALCPNHFLLWLEQQIY